MAESQVSPPAEEIVEDAARLAAAFPGEPSPLREIAGHVGIRRIEIKDDMPGQGLLMPDRGQGGFVALVRGGESPARQRFSLAHEIGHAMLHNRGIPSGLGCKDPEIERVCDRIAAELVLPRVVLDEAPESPRLQAVLDLADRYVVSPFTALLRIVETDPSLAAVAWGVRSRPGSTAKLRVIWAKARPGVFVPRYATPPEELGLESLPLRRVVSRRLRLRLGSLAGEFTIESARLSKGNGEAADWPEAISLIATGDAETAPGLR